MRSDRRLTAFRRAVAAQGRRQGSGTGARRALTVAFACIGASLVSDASLGSPRSGSVWYVDQNAPGGSGTSWSTAFTNLHAAFAAAGPGDEIRVADGTYRPTEGTDRTIAFVPDNEVSILGGFAGFGAASPDARDISLYPTILSGAIGTSASTDNSYSVVRVAGQQGVVIDGVTIRDGYASNDVAPYERGGGLRVSSGAVTLSHCIVRDNGGLAGGGGAANYGTLTLIETSFIANTDLPGGTGNGGGAVYAGNGATLTIEQCSFTGNAAPNAPILRSNGATCILRNTVFSGHVAGIQLDEGWTLVEACQFPGTISPPSGPSLTIGGACTIRDSTFTSARSEGVNPGALAISPIEGFAIIENCTFIGNRSASRGGAIGSSGGVLIRNSLFKDNATEGNGQSNSSGGGAIFTHAGQDTWLHIIDCTFEGNVAPLSPQPGTIAMGGAVMSSAPTVIANSRFLKNSAMKGGAVRVSNDAQIASCEFSGNATTTLGGTIANEGGHLELRNSTLYGNSTTSGPTAGVLITGLGSITTLANTILWGNTVAGAVTLNAQLVDAAPGSPSVDHCTISQLGFSTLGGVGNSGADPKFVLPLGPDGVVGTLDDNLRLQDLSPAIDSGANELLPIDSLDVDGDGITSEALPLDIDGEHRVTDGPGSGVDCFGHPGVVDRGAHEHAGSAFEPLVGDLDGDGAVDGADLGALLGAWGPCPAACCVADLDLDGFITAADLAILLGELWGADS